MSARHTNAATDFMHKIRHNGWRGGWRGYQQFNGDWLEHNNSRTHGKRHLRKFCHGRPSRAVVAHVVVVVSCRSNNKTMMEESALSCRRGEVDSIDTGTGGYRPNIEFRVYEWGGVIEVGRLRSRCKRGRADISPAWNWNSLHHFL